MRYLITGADFANKGAESMLYTLITEIKNRDENSKITVLCLHGFEKININDFDNITIVKENKNLSDASLSFFKYLVFKLKKVIYSLTNNKRKLAQYDFVNIYKNNDVFLDISGYALSSQWGNKPNKRLLDLIKIAKKYNKKIFLLPQSFGPFNFSVSNKKLINILSAVDKIFCREKDGYDLLKSYGLNNIVLANDIVLESNKPYKHIYRKNINKTFNFHSSAKKVLIIPNKRVFERSDNNKLYDNYQNCIKMLLSKGYQIYITYYDLCDIDICKNIKEYFKDNSDVIFIDEYFNCIDFSNLLSNFDFLISSRFHSIVHAYKQYIPCIIIGWAVKYIELAQNLGQETYMFDARNGIDNNNLVKILEYLILHKDEEKK